MKTFNYIFAALCISLCFSACKKELDKSDLTSIPGNLVYNDSTLAKLNVDYIYDQNLPTWFGSTGGSVSSSLNSLSDESYGTSKFFEGTITSADVTDFGTALNVTNSYGKIRTINMFISDLNAGTIAQASKNRLKAQAYFFRAFRYFDLVRLYGGVPLVLTPLEAVGVEAKEAAFIGRSKTSECITQIVADLDTAIKYLPGKWSSSADWGRITRGAAAAFKGRVLLTWASPQFNPGDLKERWQASYDANLQAKNLLTSAGFGLNTSYDNMWFTEVNNPEAVLVTGFNTATGDQTKKNNSYDNSTRPSYLGTGGGSNQPSLEMVNAYPMKDGKKITDPTSTYTYNSKLFYKNRDPRFDKTIGYNGAVWPLLGVTTYKLWTYFALNTANPPIYVTNEIKASATGFYTRKAIDPNVSASAVVNSGTDWMEIRYAEVLLNLSESACGIGMVGSGEDGYKGIIDVRKRAGIEAGSNNLYGLQAGMTRSELFEANLYERQIEFAFEGKRFWDLRRWKLFETVLNGKRRTGLQVNLKTGTGIPTPAVFATTRNDVDLDLAYNNYFDLVTVIKDTQYAINWKSTYYFFAIPPSAIDNNPKLIQNNNWGGSFDPLQ